MTPWIIVGACYVGGMSWLVREIRRAPKGCLPYSRKCSWCGQHMSETDKWLEDNGALVTHTICRPCEANLMGEI